MKTRILPLLALLAACTGETPNTTDATDTESDASDTVGSLETGDIPDTPPDEPWLLDEATDLALRARLSASGTRVELLWPREAYVGAATIRDDSDATAWQAPVGETSYLCLDLNLIANAPLMLDSVRFEATGMSGSARVELSEYCGGLAAATFENVDSGELLALDQTNARAITLHFAAADDLRVAGVELLSRDSRTALPQEDITVSERTFAQSGVIEGFYGVPWSWREREAMVRLIAQTNQGAYVYAPKDDLLHRNLWRDPYDAEFLERFGAFARFADQRGVDVYYAIAPFRDWRGDDDLAVLIEKLGSLYDAGARHFAVLADDIEFDLSNPIDGVLGQLHTNITNAALAALRERDPDVTMWFVGTVYHDRQRAEWAGGDDYLRALSELDDAVEILWTGRDVSVATMTAADMEAVTGLVGRPPVIWDNLWANDGGDGFTGRLLLRPFQGRDAALLSAVGGIAHNPMIQGSAARLPLAGFGEWLADPNAEVYSLTETGIGASVTDGLGSPARRRTIQFLEFVTEIYDGDAQTDASFAAGLEEIGQLMTVLDEGGVLDTALNETAWLFGRMASIQSELYHSTVYPDLADELYWPLERVRLDGEAGLAVLSELVTIAEGGDVATARLATNRKLEELATARFRYGPGLAPILREAIQRADEAGRIADLPLTHIDIGEWTPAECVVGRVTAVDVSMSPVANLIVFGIPEFLSGDREYKFVAPHPGVYEGWIIGTHRNSFPQFGARPFRIECTAPQ